MNKLAGTSKVAIVGMSGRFPGAGDIERFWRNLADGTSGIREVTGEELAAARVSPAELADPSYVRRAAPLLAPEYFDAAFFGFSPWEARITDPQQRLLLECSWEALESAGYRPDRMSCPVGVFAGCGPPAYHRNNVLSQPEVREAIGDLERSITTDSDCLSAKVAYKLGLTGPVLTVLTACSTSLVAVHLAVRSLLAFECDVALAGASFLNEIPGVHGYRADELQWESGDGVVRCFDADAHGTVLGSGVGVFALKRLTTALRDGDHIHAVVIGSAVNNDGCAKASFTAQGLAKKADVISGALSVADVDPATIGYVECNDTGEPAGGETELAALSRVFPVVPGAPVVLASIKSAVGHLDRAAGAAELIRAVLALERTTLPGTANFRTPNRPLAAAMAEGRFTVLTENRPWARAGFPRRAGVSSFGLGGTNAHVVVEEAPPPSRRAEEGGRQALVLSARTPTALAAAVEALRAHLAGRKADVADVAFTLQVSRTGFPHRAAVICDDLDDAVHALADSRRVRTSSPVTSAGSAVIPDDVESAVKLWLDGADVEWAVLHDGARRRVPLPTYPFERQRYWVDFGDYGLGDLARPAGHPPKAGNAIESTEIDHAGQRARSARRSANLSRARNRGE